MNLVLAMIHVTASAKTLLRCNMLNLSRWWSMCQTYRCGIHANCYTSRHGWRCLERRAALPSSFRLRLHGNWSSSKEFVHIAAPITRCSVGKDLSLLARMYIQQQRCSRILQWTTVRQLQNIITCPQASKSVQQYHPKQAAQSQALKPKHSRSKQFQRSKPGTIRSTDVF